MTHADYARTNFLLAPAAPSKEWRIVLLFYAAVHAANHVIYRGADVNDRYDHDKRGIDIEKHTTLKTYSRKYRELRRMSEVARYKPFLHPLPEAQVVYAESISRNFLGLCGISVDPEQSR
jgi:hypothetical protein